MSLFFFSLYNNETSHSVNRLKHCLCEFSPFPGRIRNVVSVELLKGDRLANVKLSEILENPKMGSIQQLIPINPYNDYEDEGGVPVLVVQLAFFTVATLGLAFAFAFASHTKLSMEPHFPHSLLCGLQVLVLHLPPMAMAMTRESHPLSTRLVVFPNREMQDRSCDKISSNEKISRPSMVISHVVNLRGRMDLPLQETTERSRSSWNKEKKKAISLSCMIWWFR
ncbi:hypothetical protein G4B88_023706 [Cannabis sativa]|uniref:Uncharacterized protein n=1 Tax=Cannabis sativa TaxID=3483 RepID=A0A7J6HV57_CANSA|nr:hypothetical protein G4B88_023706 [Cannabis sativa]